MGWKKELWPEWEIESEIGAGSCGVVYKIKRQDIGGTYYSALKVISIPTSREETESLRNANMSDDQIAAYYQRFANDLSKEFSVMEKLKGNTNIVSYEDHKIIPHKEDFGWDILIRMELLMPLNEFIQNNEIEESDVIRIGLDICNALKLCECENIIHRDIKPGNVFVTSHGNYKLGDFSIALTSSYTTTGNSPKGTYNFMAPEVYAGRRYDHTIDIYSLGLILYRLLNRGRMPFLPLPPETISYEMVEEANYKRLYGAPLPRPVDASPSIAGVILKACSFHAEKRFQTAEEFQKALESCAASQHGEKKYNATRQVSKYIKNLVSNICGSDNEETVTEIFSYSDNRVRTQNADILKQVQEKTEPVLKAQKKPEAAEPTKKKAESAEPKKSMDDFFLAGGDL